MTTYSKGLITVATFVLSVLVVVKAESPGAKRDIRIPLELTPDQLRVLDEIILGPGYSLDIAEPEGAHSYPIKAKSLSMSTSPSGKYYSTAKKYNYGEYGASCSRKSPCNREANLVCIEGECTCDSSTTYSTLTPHCLSKVGGGCRTSVDCVKNTVCTQSGRCLCKPGYVEDASGMCFLGYDMPCEGKHECNPSIPLVCKNYKCSCRESSNMYDEYRKSCVGLVGAECSPHRFMGNSCVSGAVCEQFNKNLPGRCVCPSYKLEAANRTCIIDTDYVTRR